MEVMQKLLLDLEKSVQCAICLDSLKNPMTTRCDHNFCEYCIKKTLKGKVEIPCPLCKKVVRQRSLKKAVHLCKIVSAVHKITNTIQEEADLPYTLSQSTRNITNQNPASTGKTSEDMLSVVMSSTVFDDQEIGPLSKRIRLDQDPLPGDDFLSQKPSSFVSNVDDKSMQYKNGNEMKNDDHTQNNLNRADCNKQEENTEESVMLSAATSSTNVVSKFVVAADVHPPPKTRTNDFILNIQTNMEVTGNLSPLPVISASQNSDLSIAYSQALVNGAALSPNSCQEYSERFSENIVEDSFDFPPSSAKKKATKTKKTSKSHKATKPKKSEWKGTRQSIRINKDENASKEEILSEATASAETNELKLLKEQLAEVENFNLTIEKNSQSVQPVSKKTRNTAKMPIIPVTKCKSDGNKDDIRKRNKDSAMQAAKESPQIARRLLSTSSSSTDSDLKQEDKKKCPLPSVSPKQQSVTDKVTNWLEQSEVDSIPPSSSPNEGMDSGCSPSSFKSSQVSEDDLISNSQVSVEHLSNRVIVLKRRKFISPVKLDPKIQESVKNQLWARESAVFGPRKPRKTYLAKRHSAFAGLALMSRMTETLSADEVQNVDDDLPQIVSKSRQKNSRKKKDTKSATVFRKSLFEEIDSDEGNVEFCPIDATVGPLKQTGAGPSATPKIDDIDNQMTEEPEPRASVDLNLLGFSEPTQFIADKTVDNANSQKNRTEVVVETCREVLEEWTKSSINNQYHTKDEKTIVDPVVDDTKNVRNDEEVEKLNDPTDIYACVSPNTVTSNSIVPPSTITEHEMSRIPSSSNILGWYPASELTAEKPNSYLTPEVTTTNTTNIGSDPLLHSHNQQFQDQSEIQTSIADEQETDLKSDHRKHKPRSKRIKKFKEQKAKPSVLSDLKSLRCVSNGRGGTKLRIFRNVPSDDGGSSRYIEVPNLNDDNKDVIVSSQQESLPMLTAKDFNLDEDHTLTPDDLKKQGTADEVSHSNSLPISNSTEIFKEAQEEKRSSRKPKSPVRKSQRLSLKTDRYSVWKINKGFEVGSSDSTDDPILSSLMEDKADNTCGPREDNSNNIVLKHIEKAIQQANAQSEPFIWSGFTKTRQEIDPQYNKKMITSLALNKTLKTKFKRAAKSRINRVNKLKARKAFLSSKKIRKMKAGRHSETQLPIMPTKMPLTESEDIDDDDKLIPATWPLAKTLPPSQCTFRLDQSQPASVPKHFTNVSVMLKRLDTTNLFDPTTDNKTSNKKITSCEAEDVSIPPSPLLFATQENNCSNDINNSHSSTEQRNSIVAKYNSAQKSMQIDLRNLDTPKAIDSNSKKTTEDNLVKTNNRAYDGNDETDVICCSWIDDEKEKIYDSEKSCHEEDGSVDTNEESVAENAVVTKAPEQNFVNVLESLNKIDSTSLYQAFPKNASLIRKFLSLSKRVYTSLTSINGEVFGSDRRTSSLEQTEKTIVQTTITLQDTSQVSAVNQTHNSSTEFSDEKAYMNGTHMTDLKEVHTAPTTEIKNFGYATGGKRRDGRPCKAPQGYSHPVMSLGLEHKQKKRSTARKSIRRIKMSDEGVALEIKRDEPTQEQENGNSDKKDNRIQKQSFQNCLNKVCMEDTGTVDEYEMLVACTKEEKKDDNVATKIEENGHAKLQSPPEAFSPGMSEEKDIFNSNNNNSKPTTPVKSKILEESHSMMPIAEAREALSSWLSNQSAGIQTRGSTKKSSHALKKSTIYPQSKVFQQKSRNEPNVKENSYHHTNGSERISQRSKEFVDESSKVQQKTVTPQSSAHISGNGMQATSVTEMKGSSPSTPVRLPEDDPAVVSRRLAVAPKVHRWLSTHRDALSPKQSREIGIIATGLAEKEIRYVKAFAKRYGAQYYATFDSMKITHVVVKTNKQLSCNRTLKYLQGIASKKWVVSLKWIYNSLSNGSLVSEEDFEVLGDNCMVEAQSQEAFLQNGPRKSRNSSPEFKHLSDYRCVCIPPFNFITVEQASELLKLCGATVLNNLRCLMLDDLSGKGNESEVNINLIIVDTDARSDMPDFSGFRATVVSIEWVYESISRYEAQPLEDYIATGNTQKE